MTDNERRALVGIAPIVLIGRLIVLVKRGPEVEEEPNLWTLPCGVLKIGESMEAAIRDRVRTKSGLVVAPLCETLQQSYVGMYDDVGRSERFGNVAFSFLCKVVSGEMRAGPRLVDVQGFRPDQIATMKLGFDHGPILKDAIAQLRKLGEIDDERRSNFPPAMS